MDDAPKNIGQTLKEKREELGLSLDDVAEETRIRKTHLESLEENRLSALPGQAYVTGFIRIYARFLGLDGEALLAQVDNLQTPEFKPLRAVQPTRKQPQRPKKTSSGRGWGRVFAVLLLILILGAAAYFLPDQFLQQSQVVEPVVATSPEEPKVNSTLPAAEQESAPTPAEETAQPAAMDETAQPAAEGGAAQPAAEEGGSPPAAMEGGSPPAAVETPLPEEDVPVAVDQATAEAPSRSFPDIPPSGGALRMLALADSSLMIEVDDRQPHRYDLHQGLDLTWRVSERVRVELADTDVARFWLNGKEVDISGLPFFELNKPSGE